VTGLQIASHKGYEKIVKLLLERGADINKADADGNTPLHFAVHGFVHINVLNKCIFKVIKNSNY
jgi:ankyrin repeat protein